MLVWPYFWCLFDLLKYGVLGIEGSKEENRNFEWYSTDYYDELQCHGWYIHEIGSTNPYLC